MYFKRRAAVLSVFRGIRARVLYEHRRIQAVWGPRQRHGTGDSGRRGTSMLSSSKLRMRRRPTSPAKVRRKFWTASGRKLHSWKHLGCRSATRFFPYCVASGSLGDLSPGDIDPRCKSITNKKLTSSVPVIGWLIGSIQTVAINGYERLATAAGFSWFISVLITGGLIGLGAPFLVQDVFSSSSTTCLARNYPMVHWRDKPETGMRLMPHRCLSSKQPRHCHPTLYSRSSILHRRKTSRQRALLPTI